MLYLINENFKALRRGEFVQSSEGSKEFVLDTSDKEKCPALGQLTEIDKANKLGIPAKYKKNKQEYLSQIESKLGAMKMAEQNEETEESKGSKLIEEGHKAGQTKEQIIIALIGSGMKLSPASKLLKRKLTELGAIISPKERSTKAFVVLEDMKFNPKNSEDVLAGVARLVSEVAQTTDGQAMSLIRKYAKTNGIELPKKVKGAGNLRLKIFNFMINNPTSTKEAFSEFMESINRNDKAIIKGWEVFEVAQKMAQTLAGTASTKSA